MSTLKKQKSSLFATEINIGGFNLTQKALFAKNMAVMIKSGLTISEALDITADSMSGKFKSILEKIQSSVQAGNTFSDSLAKYPKVFSPLFISAVRAGEASGSLEENLEYAALQMRKEKELSAKIKGAMMYPIIVFIAAMVLGLSISFFVLPQITPLFQGLNVKLPFTTRGLISFSNFIKDHGLGFFLTILFGSWAFVFFVRREFSHPLTHWVLINLPIIKPLVRSANIARFSRTLGTLLKSGLTLSEAVATTEYSLDNYYFKKALKEISSRLNTGTPLSEHLKQHENLFPKLVSRMIGVGEKSGRLEESLYYLAEFYEEEVDNSAKTMSTAIEPVLLIGIGIVVGFLALSIITPIYSITGNIK